MPFWILPIIVSSGENYLEEKQQIDLGLSLVNYEVYFPKNTRSYSAPVTSIIDTYSQYPHIAFQRHYSNKGNWTDWFEVIVKEKPKLFSIKDEYCAFHDDIHVGSDFGVTIDGPCNLIKTPRYDLYLTAQKFNANFSFVIIENTIIYFRFKPTLDVDTLREIVDSLEKIDKNSLKLTIRSQ